MIAAAHHSQNRPIPGFTGISIRFVRNKSVDESQAHAYPDYVAKKEATGCESPNRQGRTSATRRLFFVRAIASPMSGSGGEASACRFPLSPVSQLHHLLLTPYESGLRGFTTDKEAIMPGTATSQHSPVVSLTTADELFAAAFAVARDPRSNAYKQGVLAALKFRIEGRRIPKLYDPASAEDDAYYAGVQEGHAVWRKSQAETAGAA